MHHWPCANDALVAGFPVGIIGFQGETCLDGEIQGCLVLEVDADVVIVARGGELHIFNQLAASLREVKDPAVRLVFVVAGAWPSGSPTHAAFACGGVEVPSAAC